MIARIAYAAGIAGVVCACGGGVGRVFVCVGGSMPSGSRSV